MTHTLHKAVALMLLAISILSGCDKRADDVRDSFDQYIAAISEQNVEKTSSLLCKANMEWYGTMAELVRSGTKEQILALPMLQQVKVLSLRHLTTAAEVRTADAKGVLRLMFEKGLLGASGDLYELSLDNLKLTKTSAYAKLAVDDSETNVDLSFALEDGVWKLDASTMDRKINKAIKELSQSARVSKEDLILNLVERRTGKEVDISLWNPKK